MSFRPISPSCLRVFLASCSTRNQRCILFSSAHSLGQPGISEARGKHPSTKASKLPTTALCFLRLLSLAAFATGVAIRVTATMIAASSRAALALLQEHPVRLEGLIDRLDIVHLATIWRSRSLTATRRRASSCLPSLHLQAQPLRRGSSQPLQLECRGIS